MYDSWISGEFPGVSKRECAAEILSAAERPQFRWKQLDL